MPFLLLSLSSALIGLFTGAMLFIALFLGPYWSSLSPEEFRTWFTAHGPVIGNIMLTGGVLTLVAAIAAMVANPTAKLTRIVVVSLFTIAVIYVTGNNPINAIFFSADPLSADQITQLLERWKILHWGRALFGVEALVVSFFAIKTAYVR